MGETLTKKVNLQRELEKMLPDIRGGILLHCCCAACSTSCLEYLKDKARDVSLYYFNPNIDTEREYELRASELGRFDREAGYDYPLYIEKYEPQSFTTPFADSRTRARAASAVKSALLCGSGRRRIRRRSSAKNTL